MASYTYDIDTDVGKLRALCLDTDISGLSETAILSNEQLDAFRTMASGNLFLAAAIALRAMASAVPPITYAAGDLRVDQREVARNRRLLADKYEQLAYDSPAEFLDSFVYNITKLAEDKSEYINDLDFA